MFSGGTGYADDTRQSFIKGERVSIPAPPTIADGLRVQSPGALTFPILQKTAEDVLTVSDEEIIEMIKIFFFRMKMLVEPSGAAAAAAVLAGKLPSDAKRVGVIVSGGNIDAELLSEFLQVRTSEEGDGMSPSLFLFDVRVDPVSSSPWGALIVLLVVVFVLAVAFVAGLVGLLIWFKRRKAKQAAASLQ